MYRLAVDTALCGSELMLVALPLLLCNDTAFASRQDSDTSNTSKKKRIKIKEYEYDGSYFYFLIL